MERKVTGTVHLAEALPAGATLHIYVEDVSRADAAATRVAELATPLDRPLAAGASLPFALNVPEVDARVRYNVRVHLDATGSGTVTSGDQITTQSYPVLTPGAPDEIAINLTAV